MPERRIATVLMLDVVGSTHVAAEIGDARYRELSSRFDRIVRSTLKRFGGHEEDHAGDGFFASFPQPDRAIRCAADISDRIRELGIEVRCGVHTGQTESREGKTQGIAVVIAARVMSLAGSGEVLATSTTKELVTGSDLRFEDLSAHELKGVPGTWQVFALTAIDGRERQPPLPAAEAAERRASIPPSGAPTSRRTRWIVTAAAAAAVVAIVGLVAANGGDEPAPSPGGAHVLRSGVLQVDPARDQAVVRTIELPQILLPPGNHPPISAHSIAVGQGGVWSVRPPRWVMHMDPMRDELRAQISLGIFASFSVNIAVGDDKVWAATQDGLFEVNPATDERRAAIRIPQDEVRAAAADVVVGAGYVWFGTGDGRLFRLDARSGEIERRQGFGAIDVLAFGSGSLWIGDSFGETVTRYDPDTLRRIAEIEVQAGVDSLAVGDVAVWAVSRTAGSVTAIDIWDNTAGATIQVGPSPTCITAGMGAVWVCDRDGSIRRLDEDTRSVSEIPIGAPMRGIVVDRATETIWVDVG